MTDFLISAGLGGLAGAATVWLLVRGRLAQLRRLTDHDALGRFVRREP